MKSSAPFGRKSARNPLGWKDVGKTGPKKECLGYIESVWTDMRPLSLRDSIREFVELQIRRDAAKGKC